MNKLFNQLNKVNTGIPPQAQQMANLFKNASNPQTLINNVLNSNPRLKPMVTLLKQGTNPKDLFYSMTKEQGVDPESILGLLR